ncbi:hypothetical protein [Catalinimonas niigatensis]|uniref:hypothetical protein n=1 Tax=Catalinimonas niigatensis TaxID=1397264 RepID=UPI002665938C|nr:hypothetical protein [Catalinimonas niigatensis]WPP48292.1 hypothetical protein PZB72_16595 [Catalinimonas niigatensis]
MKNMSIQTFLLAFVMMFSLSSCDLVAGIFEAGFWTAIILIVVVIIIIGVLIKKFLG